MPHIPTIHGTVAPGFEPARRAFADNFKHGEVGASFAVYRRGELVVDLWAGLANVEKQTPWERDTIGILFSSTKGLASTVLLRLHDQGKLDYDAKVTDYWPEFGQNGKEGVTVRTLLCHRSGLTGIETPLDLDDLESPQKKAEAVEQQRLFWPPGSQQGYNAISYGLYAAELARRITGESLAETFRKEVAEPLGADLHIGLDPKHDHRMATLYPAGRRDKIRTILPNVLFKRSPEGKTYRRYIANYDGGFVRKAFGQPEVLGITGANNFNLPRVHRMELAWGGGIGNARGLAKVYGALANGGTLDGHTLVSPGVIEPLTRRDSWTDRDRVLNRPMGFTLGYVKENPGIFGPSTRAFGHPGAGGVLGWCDPDANLSIGYVMNKMHLNLRSPRAMRVANAVYACL